MASRKRMNMLQSVRCMIGLLNQIVCLCLVCAIYGNMLHRFAGKGEGPGEYIELFAIKRNRENIFTHEMGFRVLVFDTMMDYVSSIPAPSGIGISVNDIYIFLPASGVEDSLINVLRIGSDYRHKVRSMLPLLVPPGYQPRGFNGYEVASSMNHDRVYVSYSAFPYIFVYDERLDHIHTISLVGEEINTILNVNSAHKIVEQESGSPPMIRQLYQMFTMPGNDCLAWAHMNILYLIQVNEHPYRIKRKVRFDYRDPRKAKGEKRGSYQ